jgi:prepilin-type N-terminal cleavage/methylation domain-containing protein
MSERGHTLVEMLAAAAIILIMASAAIPHLKAYAVEAHLLAAGRVFKGEFLKAKSIAVRSGAQTAIRFENGPLGPSYSVYMDGNRNGVLSTEIASGTDRRIAGPLELNAGATDVRVGINSGVPAIPPDSGILDPADPIRFGASNMVSFSPLGTATPGTFYLAGEGLQGAVRVTGGSARVRLMVCRGRKWVER